ncbi:hypothetical protein QM012_001027 [Aureobasidium pullulans]|uniref:Uncharacterized protein n=1 Tax=Aureobasidium pullulans TaxID=5580 RepID=A0ABR0TFH7_AURPU
MVSTTPIDASEHLSTPDFAHSASTAHHDMATSIHQSAENERPKLTLETLPPEIKNEIFSHLLLGAKVKYSTNGSWPGHKYKFDTTIMRVNKQLNQDAMTYLYGHNDFALISSKFFAFEIDRKRFLPTVATGKPARSFKSPSIEATITHLETPLCVCCNPEKHKDKDRATHALFLVADLEHLIRELRLTFHMWPSKPIYVISDTTVSPVEHIPVNVDTRIKIVWKVHPPHRQDLTVAERRAKQTRLLAPLDFPTGSGKKVSVVGVDKDIARKVTEQLMPRILSIDAVGWDLYHLLKAQKNHLDTILSQGSPSLACLIHSYTDLACAGWQLDIIGHWRYASVTRHVCIHGGMVSLCLLPWDELDDEDFEAKIADSRQLAVVSLVLGCLFTVARLGLEDKTFDHLKDCIDTILSIIAATFRPHMPFLFPNRFRALLGHWEAWYTVHESLTRDPRGQNRYARGVETLEAARKLVPAEDEAWRSINEDLEFLNRVVAGEAEPWKKGFGRFPFPCINFQGLLNSPRIYNTPVDPKPPRRTVQGWATKQGFPKPEVAAHMIQFVDDFSKLKFEERTHDWIDKALDRGHFASAFLNLPREPEESDPDLPPGFPQGIFGIEVGPVTTVGELFASMGMPNGPSPPTP